MVSYGSYAKLAEDVVMTNNIFRVTILVWMWNLTVSDASYCGICDGF